VDDRGTRTLYELPAALLGKFSRTRACDGNAQIYQTRGQFGPRVIHRRPVEFVPIPRFDPGEEDHATLAELSRQMHVRAGAIPFDSQHHRGAYLAMLGTPERVHEIAERVLAPLAGGASP
jgi:hypothetical protein